MAVEIECLLILIMEEKIITYQVLKDVFAGFVTSLCVSPTNAIFDRSVIEFANGKHSIQQGVRNGLTLMLTKPFDFFTSFKFKWMYFVYSSTYIANNISDHSHIIPGISIPIQNLIVTFIANSTTGISKDKAYTQKFGVVQPKAFPLVSLAFFILRDVIGIASAFTLPPIFSKLMEEQLDFSERKSRSIAQVTTPLIIQIFITPIHLLGLDLYNNQGISSLKRLLNIKRLYLNTLTVHMLRFLPAFGFGGIVNIQLRRALKAN